MTYDAQKPVIFTMMNLYKAMWDGHIGNMLVVKHRIISEPPDAAPFHVALTEQVPTNVFLEQESITWPKQSLQRRRPQSGRLR